MSFLDAFPVAVQSAGEATTAEMVHTTGRPGEEEGDPRHDAVSAGSSTAFLQLPPMDGPQDCLQEVPTTDTAVFLFRSHFELLCFVMFFQ